MLIILIMNVIFNICNTKGIILILTMEIPGLIEDYVGSNRCIQEYYLEHRKRQLLEKTS